MKSVTFPETREPNIPPIVNNDPKREYSAIERPKSVRIADCTGDE